MSEKWFVLHTASVDILSYLTTIDVLTARQLVEVLLVQL